MVYIPNSRLVYLFWAPVPLPGLHHHCPYLSCFNFENVGLKNVRLHFWTSMSKYNITCLGFWFFASTNVTYIFGTFLQKCTVTFLRSPECQKCKLHIGSPPPSQGVGMFYTSQVVCRISTPPKINEFHLKKGPFQISKGAFHGTQPSIFRGKLLVFEGINHQSFGWFTVSSCRWGARRSWKCWIAHWWGELGMRRNRNRMGKTVGNNGNNLEVPLTGMYIYFYIYLTEGRRRHPTKRS